MIKLVVFVLTLVLVQGCLAVTLASLGSSKCGLLTNSDTVATLALANYTKLHNFTVPSASFWSSRQVLAIKSSDIHVAALVQTTNGDREIWTRGCATTDVDSARISWTSLALPVGCSTTANDLVVGTGSTCFTCGSPKQMFCASSGDTPRSVDLEADLSSSLQQLNPRIIYIARGLRHFCAIVTYTTETGQWYMPVCGGDNDLGQLGQNTSLVTSSEVLREVETVLFASSSETNAVALDCAYNQCAFVAQDETGIRVWVWGDNALGNLGSGEPGIVYPPVYSDLVPPTNTSHIYKVVVTQHSVSVLYDGNSETYLMSTWGDLYYAPTGLSWRVPSRVSIANARHLARADVKCSFAEASPTAVAASGSSMLFLDTLGQVCYFGYASSDELPVYGSMDYVALPRKFDVFATELFRSVDINTVTAIGGGYNNLYIMFTPEAAFEPVQ